MIALLALLEGLNNSFPLTDKEAEVLICEVDKFFIELQNPNKFNDLLIAIRTIEFPSDICRFIIPCITNKLYDKIGKDKANGYRNVQDLIDFNKRLKGYFELTEYDQLSNHVRGYRENDNISSPNIYY